MRLSWGKIRLVVFLWVNKWHVATLTSSFVSSGWPSRLPMLKMHRLSFHWPAYLRQTDTYGIYSSGCRWQEQMSSNPILSALMPTKVIVSPMICLLAPKHRRNCLEASCLETSCSNFNRSKLIDYGIVSEVFLSSGTFFLSMWFHYTLAQTLFPKTHRIDLDR